jgi:hypothetical protein
MGHLFVGLRSGARIDGALLVPFIVYSSNYCLSEARVTLYKSLVSPLFDYAHQLFGAICIRTILHVLMEKQNKAAKIILCLTIQVMPLLC